MKRYSRLRLARIVVSVAITLMLTCLWAGFSDVWIALFGWTAYTQVSIVGVANTFIVTLAFWLLVTSLFGRVYCSAICPMGTWFDAISHLGRRSRLSRGLSADYHYSAPLTRWRVTTLIVTMLLVLAGLWALVGVFDPTAIYSAFVANDIRPLWGVANNLLARMGVVTGLWSVTYVAVILSDIFVALFSALLMLAVSIPAWLYGRTYCNSVCPVGTVLGLVSRSSVWRVDIDTDKCINCRECEHVCKASCIDLTDHVVDASRCVNCFDCLPVCPNDAIFYRPTRKQLSIPMMQRIKGPEAAMGASAPLMMGSTQTEINTDKPDKNETIHRIAPPCDGDRR